MAVSVKSTDGYHIDYRVTIALDALRPGQKLVVRQVLGDRESFLAYTNRHQVRKISRSQPIYAVGVPSGLDIIYRVTGGDIEVMDLMGKASFRRFGAKKKLRGPKSAKKPGGMEA